MFRIKNPFNPIPYEGVDEGGGSFLWRKSLSNNGWFFIAVLISLKSDRFKDFSKQYPKIFRKEHFWSTNGYRSYLNSQEYYELSSMDFLEVSKHKDIYPQNFTYSTIDSYSLIATESFDNEKCISTRFERFYCEDVSQKEIDKIRKDSRVYHAFPIEDITFNSRFSVGYLQSGVNKNEYEDEEGFMYRTPRTLLQHGIDGTGEIVSVIDTGVNYNHTFFYDPDVEVPMNTTDMAHRKIVRYDPAYDNSDYDGHGTRVCGLICGTPLDQQAANKLYEGVAPGSRLHVVDMTDRSTQFQVEVDPFSQIEIMNDIDAHISSNSWSSNAVNDLTTYYNGFAYDNKDILYIFPSGNGGRANNFGSPTDARNVLTIGFTTRPSASQIENSKTIVLTNGTKSIDVLAESGACSVYQTQSPLKSFKDLEISTEDEEGKAFLTNSCPLEPINAALVIAATIDDCNDPENVQTLYVDESLYDSISEMITVSVEFVTPDNPLSRSTLSNTGPTQYQFKKPELVAPGENIKSAAVSANYTGDTSFDSLSADSGASFAVPQIAGLAALARQYFAQGFYPTLQKNEANIIKPSSSLLKAVLINSAKQLGSSIIDWECGFGIPVLQDSLGFGDYGVRFVDRQPVKPHSVYAYKIKTTRESLLSITMSYIDYYSSLFLYCDLDLVVMNEETGEVWTGNNLNNHRPEEFQTNERVYIQNAPIGTYTIYVYSSLFNEGTEEEPIEIDFALAIMGGFDTNDETTNPYHLELLDLSEIPAPGKCSERGTFSDGICQCPLPYTGHMCEYEMKLLKDFIGNFDFYKVPLDYVDYQYRTFPPGSRIKLLFGGMPYVFPFPQMLNAASYDEPKLSNGYDYSVVQLDAALYITDFKTPPEGSSVIYFSMTGFGTTYSSDACIYIQIFPPRTPEITPFITPDETPYITPFITPAISTPVMTPFTTPYGTPYQTPYTTPYETPMETPSMTPSISTPVMTPSYSTPIQTPAYTTPLMTPVLTPEETIARTLLPTPRETPSYTPGFTPFITPKNTIAATIFIPSRDSNDNDNQNTGGVKNEGNTINIGAIIGGVIGGLVAIAIIIVLIIYFKNRSDVSEADDDDIDYVITEHMFENIDGNNNQKFRSYLETIPVESEIGMSESDSSSFSSSEYRMGSGEDFEFGF